jgi:hypothetical protein
MSTWYVINGEAGTAASTITGNFVSSSGYTSSAGTNLVATYTGSSKDIPEPEAVILDSTKKIRGAKPKENKRPAILDKKFSPKIYFRFIKSKLTKIEQDLLREQLNKLKPMLIAANQSGQRALYEKLSVHAAVAIKEQEALAIGCGTRIPKKIIDRFIPKVVDKVVKFDLLANFPRPIPVKVRTRIAEVREKQVFDEFHILYVDYTEEAPLKTTAKKIREKDPILFGTFKFQPDVFYFIVDWVDKYCDITLSKVVETIQLEDPEYQLDMVPEVDEDYFNEIVKKVNKSHERLKKTNSRNFEELEAEENEEFNAGISQGVVPVQIEETPEYLPEKKTILQKFLGLFKGKTLVEETTKREVE